MYPGWTDPTEPLADIRRRNEGVRTEIHSPVEYGNLTKRWRTWFVDPRGHGCYQELLQLLDVARVRDDDLLLSVGDVVDRGPEPLAVIDLFRTRPRSLVLGRFLTCLSAGGVP